MKPFKGTPMPGHMGDEQTTVQNLRLVRVDKERGLLLVRGAVPGGRRWRRGRLRGPEEVGEGHERTGLCD